MAIKAKALSHPARLEILRVLSIQDGCICGVIVDELPLAQASVSRHLKVLIEAGFIQGAIEGPSVCYCLDPNVLQSFRTRVEGFLDNLNIHSTCC